MSQMNPDENVHVFESIQWKSEDKKEKSVLGGLTETMNKEINIKLDEAIKSLNDENLNHEIQDRFLIIENEIDRRIESLISELHDYRDEFRREVGEIKNRIITSSERKKLEAMQEKLKYFKSETSSTSQDYIYKQNTLLKEANKILREYFNQINKIQFTTLETKLEKTLIGELVKPTVSYSSIKQNAHLIVTGSSGKLESIALLKNQNKLILSDKNGGLLKIIDLDSYSIDSFKNANIKKPAALCIGKNDVLFVSDHAKFDKILVFDTINMNYLRQFKIKPMFVSNMKIDLLNEQNLLYLSDTGDDKIVVRFSETDKFKTIINIMKPNFMEFSEEFMYVTSQPDFNLNKKARRLEGLQKGSNCIFILNKKNYEIVKKITFENWLVPFGLHLDKNLNILTTASELSETRIVSENPFLYFINSSGELVQKTEIEIGLKRPCSISFHDNYFFICDDTILSLFEIHSV